MEVLIRHSLSFGRIWKIDCRRQQGLKPWTFSVVLRGAEAPLFHPMNLGSRRGESTFPDPNPS